MAEESEEQGDTKNAKGDAPSYEEEESSEGDDGTVDSEAEEEEDDEEDDEPKLKYARMTGHLTPLYRNGDATSAFLVAGDKMVCV